MRKLIALLFIAGISIPSAFSQPETNNQPPTNERKIQMAILFDASGSMNGLLSQAKARMWSIVNELTALRYEDVVPTVEIALYSYGYDGHPGSEYFTKQLVPLTTDLDLISEKLFSITTNGGSEYCGGVIEKSLDDLAWSTEKLDLKMIYIAGNEPFNQGPIDYKTVCKSACEREIFINTIHCGPYEVGVKHFWFDGAQIGCGDYFHIDADKSIQHITTPYDSLINVYNDSLNTTYIEYGSDGKMLKERQAKQDVNAQIMSPSSKAERSIAKSKANYTNTSWDIVDAEKDEDFKIEDIKEEQLPEILKGKTTEEKKKIIGEKSAERDEYQKKIAQLGKDRLLFIEEEKTKLGDEGASDFGTSVSESIEKKSTKIGYKKQK
ncbi:hypothetical protein N8328_00105 [Crocinitomicaceae bacterium]|nr:hypothetical protein [Crocinitomicaceae bacterium]